MYIPAIGGIQPGTGGGSGGSSSSAAPFTESILESAANAITVSFDEPERIYNVAFNVKSNAASNLVFVTLNGETAQTNYSVLLAYNSSSNFAHVAASSNSAILQNAGIGSGAFASGTLTVQRIYDGSNTRFTIRFATEIAAGHTVGFVTKTESGDVDLTSLSIRSNQANGFTAASYLKPIY